MNKRNSSKHKIKKSLFFLNELIFPHIYVLTNVLLLIELATYRGFSFKYLFLDTSVLVLLCIVSLLLIVYGQLNKVISVSKLKNLVLQINKLALLPLIIINYLLISIDDYYYNNYLYSKFHINPHSFQLILSFNIAIFFINYFIKFKVVSSFISQLISTKSLIHIIFFFSVIFFVLPQANIVSTWMYQSSFKIIRTIKFSWKDKLIYLNGGEDSTGWIVEYTDFINKHVEPNGVIFIPPQKEAWQMEGNPYYMRWFIYPRDTIQVQEITADIPHEATYVLIDNGAWPGMTEYGWPRIFIPAEKIEKMVFIDRDTLQETEIKNTSYDPATMSYQWGVIKLKK